MREALLLIKATKKLGDSMSNSMRRVFVTVLLVFAAIAMLLVTFQEQKADYSSVIINFMNMLNFSTLYIVSFGYILRIHNAKNKYDFLKFVVQLPVTKKSYSTAKFINIWIGMLPTFLILAYLNVIVLIKGLSGIAGYIGFCTVISCWQLLFLSFISGINSYIDPKKGLAKFFGYISVFSVFTNAVVIFGTIIFNEEDTQYAMLGTGLIKLFKSLEVLSGAACGACVVLVMIISYLVGCVIPEKLFTKKGWNV